MEIFYIIFMIVNFAFVAFGIFAGIETLRVRAKENADRRKTASPLEKIFADKFEDKEFADKFENYRSKFKEEFLSSDFGENIVKALYMAKTDKNIRFDGSKLVRKYRSHLWIPLNKIFRPDSGQDIIDDTFFSFFPIILMIPLVIVGIIFKGKIEIVILAIMAIMFILFYICPLGVYRDTKEGEAKVIYGPLNLGQVRSLSFLFAETESDKVNCLIHIGINCYFKEIKVPIDFKANNLNEAAREYVQLRKYFSPITKKSYISYIKLFKVQRTITTFFKEIYYGWIRIIWLIGEKVRNIF